MRRLAIIGTRHVHAAGLARCAASCGWTLSAAVEPSAADAAAWEQLGLAPLRSLDDALADADAVIVAGTNRERARDAVAALDAGLAVLCEKPVAIDETALAQLTAAADGRRFCTALPVRFGRSLQRAKELIVAGQIGTPLGGRATNHGQFPGGWFGTLGDAGGGAIMDHTVHVSDAYCWLLGERIRDVYAVSSNAMHPELEVDSAGVVTMGFGSGFFASVDASWSRPESFHTWGDVWMEVMGSEGRLLIDPMARHLQVFSDSAGKLTTVGYDEHDMTADLVRRFLDYAVEGGDSPVPFEDGAHASEVVFAAYRSARLGHPTAVNG
jgi:predicted dehydrogenase